MSNRTIEINEAINSGEYLLNVIDNIITSIDKAKNWGIVDLAVDNSILSSIIKNKRLHEANDNVPVLKEALESFNNELQDVKVYYQTKELKMSKAIEVFDCFLDNTFIDGYTFIKILESKKELNNLKKQVQDILDELRRY